MREQTEQLLRVLRDNRGTVWTAVAVLAVLLVFGVVSGGGQRLLAALGFTESVGIQVVAPRDGTAVYLNGRPVATNAVTGERINLRAVPVGEHTIIAAKPGYFPWMKEVTVTATEKHLTLRPFLVNQQSDGSVIPANSQLFQQLKSDIDSSAAPGPDNPITSPSGNIVVWFVDNAIHAHWQGDPADRDGQLCQSTDSCPDTVTVTPAKTPVRDLAFYRDREDVIILSAQNGVYVLEITSDGTQNFQPLYEGSQPRFTKTSPHTITVLDAGRLREIRL